MTTKNQSHQIAVVAGDVTMDWNIAHLGPSGEDAPQTWHPDQWAKAYWQRGGAALLVDLIQEVVQSNEKHIPINIDIRSLNTPQDHVVPGDERFHFFLLQFPFRI